MVNFSSVGEEEKWPIGRPEIAERTFYDSKRVLWSFLKSFHTVVAHRSPLHHDPHSFENHIWSEFIGVFLAYFWIQNMLKIHQKSHFKYDFQRSADRDAEVIYEWQRYETTLKNFKEHVFSHKMFFRPFPAQLLATFLLLQYRWNSPFFAISSKNSNLRRILQTDNDGDIL